MTYIQPFFPLLLMTAVIALVWQNRRKISRFPLLIAILLFAFCWTPVAKLGLLWFELPYRSQPPADKNVQAIVVLSSSVLTPEPPKPAPVLGSDTYERCLYAAWLYKNWLSVPVLASGGGTVGAPYALTMSEELRAQGVPAEMIWTEERSRSTHENAEFSARILRSKGIRRIALVTEAYHMRRATKCFEKEGISVVSAACGFRTVYEERPEEFLPSWEAISWNEDTLHEAIGLLWYRLRGWIQ